MSSSRAILIVFPILLATTPQIASYAVSEPITYASTGALLNPRQRSSAELEAQKTGRLVAKYNNASADNPDELGEYFEGDIRIPYRRDGKLAYLANRYRWPNAVVPYTINGQFSKDELNIIKWAMDEFRQKTCINFKPRSGEKDYVSIVSGKSGCWAAVGRSGGKQEVNFQAPACLWKRGVVLHELMHAVGFLHEHSRHDRDAYVTVNTQNIESGKQSNFNKTRKDVADGLSLSYDYASVMHYSAKAFSKNEKPTIVAKKDTEEAKQMGQRDNFSALDVAKLRALYKC